MEARGTTRDDWREKIERGITFDLKKKRKIYFLHGERMENRWIDLSVEYYMVRLLIGGKHIQLLIINKFNMLRLEFQYQFLESNRKEN